MSNTKGVITAVNQTSIDTATNGDGRAHARRFNLSISGDFDGVIVLKRYFSEEVVGDARVVETFTGPKEGVVECAEDSATHFIECTSIVSGSANWRMGA